MTARRYSKIATVLSQRQPDLTLVTDAVHKAQNLSAIVRTCDAVGIMQVHSVSEKPVFGAHTGTSVGTHKWVETLVYQDIAEPLANLSNRDYQIVAADIGTDAKDYREVDYTRPTALLLGAEKYGISEGAYPYVDQYIRVPLLGMVESFNVSVACAIILAEVRRQREEAGFYNSCRLQQDRYRQLLFEWMQPLLASYCQKHHLPYPALNEQGEIVDPKWREAQYR